MLQFNSTVVAAVLLTFTALADTPAPENEANLLVNADRQLATQGDQSLGDRVDLYTGSLTFMQTDVLLPGNSALPVAIQRRFDVARTQTQAQPPEFYSWQARPAQNYRHRCYGCPLAGQPLQ